MSELGQIKVLYIEDDEGHARLVQRNLERLGYSTEIVNNGKDGLEKINSDYFDIILIDADIPGIAGIEIVRMISSKEKLLPMIMVTGHGNETIAVEAMKLGVDDYIVKDPNNSFITLLPSVIENAIKRKQLVHDRLKMEEKMRWLSLCIESAGEAIVITDIHGNILFTNQAFTKLTGYTVEEALGQNSRILKTERHHGEFYKQMWDTILSGKIWEGELTNKCKDGTFYEAYLTIAPVLNKDNKIEKFVAIQSDITERLKMEKSREKLIINLQKALDKIKTLSGFLPICASCKKIRDDKGYWNQIENYISEHSCAEFTHSICPECVERLYPDFSK